MEMSLVWTSDWIFRKVTKYILSSAWIVYSLLEDFVDDRFQRSFFWLVSPSWRDRHSLFCEEEVESEDEAGLIMERMDDWNMTRLMILFGLFLLGIPRCICGDSRSFDRTGRVFVRPSCHHTQLIRSPRSCKKNGTRFALYEMPFI
jgi:hypothetical protein